MKFQLLLAAALLLTSTAPLPAQNAPLSTEATLYATMPSTAAHRPEMALDGDANTYFKSAYGMDEGDDFTVLFSRLVPLRSLRIATGNLEGDDLLTQGRVEVSSDGLAFTLAANFDTGGVASAKLAGGNVAALRIKIAAGTGLPSLVLREISLDSDLKIAHVGWGAGRAFSDFSAAPDLASWARRADAQMDEFWPDMAALLYSDGFITPNKVNVFYRGGPDVTPVAATGGGVMTVNVAWARAHPEDTGLTVHEVAHVVQSMSAYNPVWLIEGIADYLRWVKFEPQNYTVQINPAKATYHDSYRTTGAFLAWCEMHYDSRLVSKLNRDVRFGAYSEAAFKTYCGKDVDSLWSEFLAAYRANPGGILAAEIAPADRPRALPVVAAGTSVAVDLRPVFNTVGLSRDGEATALGEGFDGEGATLSGDLVGKTLDLGAVRWSIGPPARFNVVTARGGVVALPSGRFASLWLLGAAVEGAQRGQKFAVTYSDGTSQTFVQNFSDWFAPQGFPGETRALKMKYRNRAGGARDARPFSLYAYGFALDKSKAVKTLTLPDNPNLKIAALSLAN